MSLLFRDNSGNEAPIAGLNGTSGKLVPSVTYMQSGTVTCNISDTDNLAQATVTFSTPMPDADYIINIEVTGWGGAGNLGTNISISSKSKNGFTIRQYVSADVSTPSMTYKWQAFKPITNEQVRLDEGQITQNASDIAALTPGVNRANKLTVVENISNTDLNTITTTGNYYASSGNTHSPENYIMLNVVSDGATPPTITQTAIGINSNKFYTRTFYAGTTWSNWQHIAPLFQYNMEAGNVLTLAMSSTAFRKIMLYNYNSYIEVMVHEWGAQAIYHWIVGSAFPSDFSVSYSGYNLAITCNSGSWRCVIEAPDGQSAIRSYV